MWTTGDTGYIPENEHEFWQFMFVCNQITTIMTHILYCVF